MVLAYTYKFRTYSQIYEIVFGYKLCREASSISLYNQRSQDRFFFNDEYKVLYMVECSCDVLIKDEKRKNKFRFMLCLQREMTSTFVMLWSYIVC